MSAYSKTPTEFRDGELLIKALEEMGFKPTNALENPMPLVGYQGDYRTADGEGHTKSVAAAMKAHVIIPRKQVGGASNDIGFVRGEDGKFHAILSDYDRACGKNEKWVAQVNVGYQHLHLHKQASKMGYRVVVNGQKRAGSNHILDYTFIKQG